MKRSNGEVSLLFAVCCAYGVVYVVHARCLSGRLDDFPAKIQAITVFTIFYTMTLRWYRL